MAAVNPLSAQLLTLPVSVSTSASTSAALPAVGNQIRIFNEGPNDAFVSIGSGAQAATLPNATVTATSVACPAREDLVFSLPAVSGLQISAITRTGTATLDVSVGDGI